MGYKVQHSQLPVRIIEACTTDANAVSLIKTHKYQTHRKKEPNKIRAKTELYNTSFMAKCMAEYQSLLDQIHLIPEFSFFVKAYKNHLIN